VTSAIVARGLERSFGAKRAVRPFDVSIEPGAVTGLLGPNGSGKSTFLRMLVGLVPKDGGEATLAGVPLKGDGTAVRKRVTFLPGTSAMALELTGARHLAWLCRARGGDALARATRIAGELDLPLKSRVRVYSHGMKRLLLLAANLGPDVPVRILDEPTDGLDPTRRAQVLDLLGAEAERGTCVLLSSHHLGEIDRACTRVLFLSDGALIADQSSAELHERTRRIVRVGWPAGTDAAAFAPRLESLGATAIRVDGARATATLPEPDPRAFLAALAAADDLPAPEKLAVGELSLGELYRDLYGVEGV